MRQVFTIYFPNRITTKQKRSTDVERFFRMSADRQELALVRDDGIRKKAALLSQGVLLPGQ